MSGVANYSINLIAVEREVRRRSGVACRPWISCIQERSCTPRVHLWGSMLRLPGWSVACGSGRSLTSARSVDVWTTNVMWYSSPYPPRASANQQPLGPIYTYVWPVSYMPICHSNTRVTHKYIIHICGCVYHVYQPTIHMCHATVSMIKETVLLYNKLSTYLLVKPYYLLQNIQNI